MWGSGVWDKGRLNYVCCRGIGYNMSGICEHGETGLEWGVISPARSYQPQSAPLGEYLED